MPQVTSVGMISPDAGSWWQQPLYLEIENPRTYVELIAPDPPATPPPEPEPQPDPSEQEPVSTP